MSDPTEDIVLLTLLDEWGLPDEAAGHVRGTFAYQTRLLATRTADLGADIWVDVHESHEEPGSVLVPGTVECLNPTCEWGPGRVDDSQPCDTWVPKLPAG